MTLSLAIRSALVLLLTALIAIFTVTHASVPPRSAVEAALNGETGSGGVIPTPPSYPQRVGKPPAHTATPNAGPSATAPPPTATPKPVVISSGLAVDSFFDLPGHIYYTDPQHNIRFITGQRLNKRFTGDGASVSPAISPDGQSLAWVLYKRNYSDIEATSLGYRSDGSIVAISTTVLTQDHCPPAALQRVADYSCDPRFDWWANKPSWLPDSQHLLYESDRPGFDPNNAANATLTIWEQGLTDSLTNAVRLSLPQPVAGTGGHDSPAWRPGDPSTFIYANYGFSSIDNARQGVIEVGAALTDTAPVTPAIDLTPQGVTEYHPVWSPDGRFIAFVQDVSQNGSTLLLMPFTAPGSADDYGHAITVTVGNVSQPFWSPDGRYLGYLTSDGGDYTMVIRRVYLNGKRPRFGPPITLTQAGAVSAEYRPSWGK